MAMQEAQTSSLTQMTALGRFGKNISLFWRIVVFASVLISLLNILAHDPSFYAGPRGWGALALALCYLIAFTYGAHWIAGSNPDDYWKTRINCGRVLFPWRAVALWAVLVALSVVMFALDTNFLWLIWIPYGMSFTLLALPRGLLLIVPTAFLVIAFNQELPKTLSMPDLVNFTGLVLGMACYSAVIYMPIVLLRHRFQRERMYADLEQSHRELEAAHQQLEHAATHERELAVLRERGRLARDMHDTLGHSLALMTVKLEAAQRLRLVDPDRADHEVAATQAIARGALAELRAAIANLRTPGGSSESLANALSRAVCDGAARTGWQVTCEIAPDVEPLSDQVSEALLRTGIEALTNIERHADAHAVCIQLTRQHDTVILRIEDDGVGILTTNPPQRIEARTVRGTAMANGDDSAHSAINSPQGHFGITGMRERTAGVSGTVLIGAGANGRGTCVEVRLPVAAE
ncbi:MAG TPA: sensor histidine kinase [Ktedonobacterales bacterium]|nr:sensor histidine kinase [Ktedonobacterales bacterium]